MIRSSAGHFLSLKVWLVIRASRNKKKEKPCKHSARCFHSFLLAPAGSAPSWSHRPAWLTREHPEGQLLPRPSCAPWAVSICSYSHTTHTCPPTPASPFLPPLLLYLWAISHIPIPVFAGLATFCITHMLVQGMTCRHHGDGTGDALQKDVRP